MQANDYQEEAMVTCGAVDYFDRLVMGSIGLAGETGEVNDLIKKFLFHSAPLDRDKLQKELGDVLWYLCLLATSHDMKLEDIMQKNLDKLRKRYPAGFSAEASKNRTE